MKRKLFVKQLNESVNNSFIKKFLGSFVLRDIDESDKELELVL